MLLTKKNLKPYYNPENYFNRDLSWLELVGESDKYKIGRVQHQFKTHENHNGILTQKKAHNADAK